MNTNKGRYSQLEHKCINIMAPNRRNSDNRIQIDGRENKLALKTEN